MVEENDILKKSILILIIIILVTILLLLGSIIFDFYNNFKVEDHSSTNTDSTDYELSNPNKNYIGPNLSDEEYMRVLEIILLNDETNIKEIIDNGNYILKDYYIAHGQIYFDYVQEGNESNNLQIFSWVEYSLGWNIEGQNRENIYGNNKEVFELESIIDEKKYYCIDYDLKITKNMDEMKEICSKLGFE